MIDKALGLGSCSLIGEETEFCLLPVKRLSAVALPVSCLFTSGKVTDSVVVCPIFHFSRLAALALDKWWSLIGSYLYSEKIKN